VEKIKPIDEIKRFEKTIVYEKRSLRASFLLFRFNFNYDPSSSSHPHHCFSISFLLALSSLTFVSLHSPAVPSSSAHLAQLTFNLASHDFHCGLHNFKPLKLHTTSVCVKVIFIPHFTTPLFVIGPLYFAIIEGDFAKLCVV